ncbi:MAG: hypothetical protein VYE77_05520 [Planctomycetota bacterium]|nr:hypothetical protein [Planctomycetota bacterium]
MPVLLTMDLLGAQAHQKRTNPHASKALWEDFSDLIVDTAESLESPTELLGTIRQGSLVLQCPCVKTALALGRRMFRRAWLETRTPHDLRLWLRGCITVGEVGSEATQAAASRLLPGVQKDVPNPSVQKAVSHLRSGYRGMRILIAEELLDDQLRGVFRIPLGRLGVIPFRRMNFTPYPKSLSQRFQDFLWMADNGAEWAQYNVRMKQRMLWSVEDTSEFVQAAATQVVFHECDAILQSVHRKNQTRREDRPAPATPEPTEGQAEGSAEA